MGPGHYMLGGALETRQYCRAGALYVRGCTRDQAVLQGRGTIC